MPILSPKLDVPLSSPHLPVPIMFRSAYVPAEGLYPQHQHAWGEFVYSFSGVMEVKVAGHHYLAPPQYGVWLPPNLDHVGLNRQEAHHASLYVSAPLCAVLPAEPCALTVSPLARALLSICTPSRSGRRRPKPALGCCRCWWIYWLRRRE